MKLTSTRCCGDDEIFSFTQCVQKKLLATVTTKLHFFFQFTDLMQLNSAKKNVFDNQIFSSKNRTKKLIDQIDLQKDFTVKYLRSSFECQKIKRFSHCGRVEGAGKKID